MGLNPDRVEDKREATLTSWGSALNGLCVLAKYSEDLWIKDRHFTADLEREFSKHDKKYIKRAVKIINQLLRRN